MPFVSSDAVEAAGASAEVVEFFYGDPDPDLVRVAGAHGALVAWQTGSAAHSGPFSDHSSGLIIFRTADEDAAEKTVADDPFLWELRGNCAFASDFDYASA